MGKLKFENVRGDSNIAATKQQLTEALFLLLDEALPHLDCELIKKRGNDKCDRCDECKFNQLLWRVKNGEKSKITMQR